MRHLGSLVLSLLLGSIVWALTGFAAVEYARGRIDLEGINGSTLLGVLLFIVAGALYTILVSARLSPIGPALVGLLYFGLSLWSMVDRSSFLDVVPRDLFNRDFALAVPAEGLGFLLAVPLLATVLSPRRWRRYDRPMPAHGPGHGPAHAYGPPGGPPSTPFPGAAPPGMPPGQPGYPPQQQASPWSPAGVSSPGMPSAGSPPPGYPPSSQPGSYPPSSGQPGSYPPSSGQPGSYPPSSGQPGSYSPPTSGPPGYSPPTSTPPSYSAPTSTPPTDATTVLGSRPPGGTPTDATTLLSGRARQARDEPTHLINDEARPPDDPDVTRRM
jgi:hypothetical protein